MSPMSRRRSIDSSDSDSDSEKSGNEFGKDYHKKDKKDKKDKHAKDKKEKKNKDEKKDKKDKDEKKDKDKIKGVPEQSHGHPSNADIDYKQARFHTSQVLDIDQPGGAPAPNFKTHPQTGPPQSAAASQSAPPSGYRVPLTTTSAFPDPQQAGPPVSKDLDGSPLFVGSALFPSSVQPCKIGPHLQPYASVPYGGMEHAHHGRYDLLPFDGNAMEWVSTSNGQIPQGRRPIEGGYEESGQKLYHAIGEVNGVWVPGKTGDHLGAAHLSFGGSEIPVSNYSILCWR